MTHKKYLALICLVFWLAMPSTSSAEPLTPTAIARGEQFWAPYNDGTAPCGGTLEITYAQEPQNGYLAWSYVRYGGCSITVWDGYVQYLRNLTVPLLKPSPRNEPIRARWIEASECAVVAHELGHDYFGLVHTSDPRNVMNGEVQVVPAACYPPKQPPKSPRVIKGLPTH